MSTNKTLVVLPLLLTITAAIDLAGLVPRSLITMNVIPTTIFSVSAKQKGHYRSGDGGDEV